MIVEGKGAVLGVNLGRPIVTDGDSATQLFTNYFGPYLFIFVPLSFCRNFFRKSSAISEQSLLVSVSDVLTASLNHTGDGTGVYGAGYRRREALSGWSGGSVVGARRPRAIKAVDDDGCSLLSAAGLAVVHDGADIDGCVAERSVVPSAAAVKRPPHRLTRRSPRRIGLSSTFETVAAAFTTDNGVWSGAKPKKNSTQLIPRLFPRR